MGASHSSDGPYDVIKHGQHGDGGRRSKAKPGQPGRPAIKSVSSTSCQLSWLPPRHNGNDVIAYTVEVCEGALHGGGGNWKIVTQVCQSPRYDARYLRADSRYSWRVRAENIYGTGKPSSPSEVALTRMYEPDARLSLQPLVASTRTELNANLKPDHLLGNGEVGGRGSSSSSSSLGLKRRHSFNVQLDGRVSKILNNTDVRLAHTSTQVAVPTTRERADSSASGRLGSLSRNNSVCSRTSLQSIRRYSTTPIMLPGTGTDSISRLRESRNSIKTSVSDYAVGLGRRESSVSRRESLSLRPHHRASHSSLGSSLSDLHTSSVTSSAASEDNRKRRDGSRDSPRSSTSDLTVSFSRDSRAASTSTSRDGSMCDVTIATDSVNSVVANSVQKLSLDNEKADIPIVDGSDLEEGVLIDVKEFISKNNDLNALLSQLSGDVLSDFSLNSKTEDPDMSEGSISKYTEEMNSLSGNDTISSKNTSTFSWHGHPKTHVQTKDPAHQNLAEDTSALNNGGSQYQDTDSTKCYYASLENPWERVTSQLSQGGSEDIMAGPFCDDIKMALYARNWAQQDQHLGLARGSSHMSNDKGSCEHSVGDKDGENFRTLRSVLQSSNMLVRTSRPQHDGVLGVVMGDGDARMLTRPGRLTTIMDAEEEDDPVRVTTL